MTTVTPRSGLPLPPAPSNLHMTKMIYYKHKPGYSIFSNSLCAIVPLCLPDSKHIGLLTEENMPWSLTIFPELSEWFALPHVSDLGLTVTSLVKLSMMSISPSWHSSSQNCLFFIAFFSICNCLIYLLFFGIFANCLSHLLDCKLPEGRDQVSLLHYWIPNTLQALVYNRCLIILSEWMNEPEGLLWEINKLVFCNYNWKS